MKKPEKLPEKTIEKKLEKEYYVDQLNSDLDYKEFGSLNKIVHSKQDFEYFIEESHIVYPLLHVKRISKGSSEKWKITLDDKNSLVIDGSFLNEDERKYLRTEDGFNLLISLFKDGVKQISTIKSVISNKLAK